MKFNRFSILAFLAISTIFFGVIFQLMPNANALIVMRSLQVGASFAVVIRFWDAGMYAWRDNFRTQAQIYAFAMLVLSLSLGMNAIWLWLWRSADEPRWMIDSWINGYLILITYLAQAGKIIAPDARPGGDRGKVILYLVLGLVITVILSVVGLSEVTVSQHLTEYLSPFFREAGPLINWPTP